MKLYETGIILSSLLEESQITRQTEQIQSLITDNGGKIIDVDRWGMRKLAYEIKKMQQGFYVFFRYEADGSVPQKLEKAFQVNESVLRFLTTVPDKAEESRKPSEETSGAPSY
jgi:small subunit ribosomal protein S6